MAVEVHDLRKSFRLPDHGPQSLGERMLHPVRRARPHRLTVLDGISFDVRSGEFFGVMGPNGSGKSTLLRILAGIYRPDSGEVSVHGSLGPFIELGVGFNPELSARQNVVLNGVMLGLTPREVGRRVEEILDFAGVEEFGYLELKHFSSGMRVRLAFAVMVQADPDVYLVDEVLAVGDPAFRERCMDVFTDLRDQGKTILFVAQQTSVIERQCDRALLLAGGKIQQQGEPSAVARRYLELNLESRGEAAGAGGRDADGDQSRRRSRAKIADLWIGDAAGDRRAAVDPDDSIELHALVEVDKRIASPGLRLELRNERGARIFTPADSEPSSDAHFRAGERFRIRATIENRLTPGRYRLICAVVHSGPNGRVAVSAARTATFEVSGSKRSGAGLVVLEHTVAVEPEQSAEVIG